MARYVQDFADGGKEHADLLGGKGANLAEMTRLGLPVPPGFTITTEACRHFMRTGAVPAELRVEVTMALRRMEARSRGASATTATRCSSRCARGRGSRCPG